MNIFAICNFKKIQGRIYYLGDHALFIDRMPDLTGSEWSGKLPTLGWLYGDRTLRDQLKDSIRLKLIELQGTTCAFCGNEFDVTSSNQIEHIAPKGEGRYPEYMFHASNLVLACSLCNGFEKKERKDFANTIAKKGVNYENHYFNIVHPYLDNPDEHYELGQLNDKITISSLSLKGQKSIAMLKLDEEPQTNARFKTLMKHVYSIDPVFRGAFTDACNRISK